MRNCSQKVSMFLALFALATIAQAGRRGEIKQQIEVRSEKLRSSVLYECSRTVRAGRLVKAQEGRDGVVKKTFRITYKNGKFFGSELLKEDRIAPQPTLYLMGSAGWIASRGSFMRSKVLTMSATAYDPSPATIGPHATGYTRNGTRATFGVVAVDPRVIPLGTLLFVEGYGFAVAADTGSAIKGRRIDLCYDSKRVADRYGRRPVRVHILKRP